MMENTEIIPLSDVENEELLDALMLNDPKFNLTKLAEECTELADACLKKVNKDEQHAPSEAQLIAEAGDVMLRIAVLAQAIDPTGEKIQAALDKKSRHLWERRDKYKGRL